MELKQETITEFRRILRRLEAEIGIQLSGETDCCGVSVAQCHLILEMEENAGACLGDIADRLCTDKSALSRTVDSLVREGMVLREENPENRRKISISLTPTGRQKADFINNLCNASYADVFARIPEEKHAQILESVRLLTDAMCDERKEKGSSCCKKT